MELFDYYKIIKEKIELCDYIIKKISNETETAIPEINSHLESIHYIMYEYLKDRKDHRIKDIFDYVCVPSIEDIDIDFVKWDIIKFLNGVIKLKT